MRRNCGALLLAEISSITERINSLEIKEINVRWKRSLVEEGPAVFPGWGVLCAHLTEGLNSRWRVREESHLDNNWIFLTSKGNNLSGCGLIFYPDWTFFPQPSSALTTAIADYHSRRSQTVKIAKTGQIYKNKLLKKTRFSAFTWPECALYSPNHIWSLLNPDLKSVFLLFFLIWDYWITIQLAVWHNGCALFYCLLRAH